MQILKDRQLLHDRHRLSHEQIDQLLGENRAKEFLQEKMMRMASVKHFLDITDLLRESGISFTCIKGPMLSFRIYGDASVRSSHDIDLLVETDSICKICELLGKANYELSEGIFWPKESFKQEMLQKCTHHLSFFNKNLKFCVEIHWTLSEHIPIRKEVADELIKQNIVIENYAGRSFKVLNREFELTYLMIHGSKHGWSRLKWLVDLKDYPMDDLDLKKWAFLIKEFHAERILGQTNLLLYQFFNNKMPLDGSKRLPSFFVRYMEKSINEPSNTSTSLRSIIQAYRYQMLLFPHIRYQWRSIMSLFSRPGDVAEHNFASKTAYYLFRPYSFIKRRILHV